VPTAFAVSTFLAGLGRIGPSRASIASSVEPVVAVACGVLVLGERLLPVQFLGAALVIAAVLAIELRRLPRIPVPPLARIRVFPHLVPRLPRADSVTD
jgi:drug/metabolite transporter (DMT)-like permease